MRLVLEAPGWAGRLCAPREMLVERMLKTDEGMHVVLFSSVDQGARAESGGCALGSTCRLPGPLKSTDLKVPRASHVGAAPPVCVAGASAASAAAVAGTGPHAAMAGTFWDLNTVSCTLSAACLSGRHPCHHPDVLPAACPPPSGCEAAQAAQPVQQARAGGGAWHIRHGAARGLPAGHLP